MELLGRYYVGSLEKFLKELLWEFSVEFQEEFPNQEFQKFLEKILYEFSKINLEIFYARTIDTTSEEIHKKFSKQKCEETPENKLEKSLPKTSPQVERI